MRLSRLAAGLTLAALVLPIIPARASNPTGGTLSDAVASLSWSGTTVAQAAGIVSEVGCITVVQVDPTCDYFALTVDALTGPTDDVEVSISTTDSLIAEYDLYIYDAEGHELGRSVDFGSNDKITLVDPAPATYTVAVQNVLNANAVGSYDGTARTLDAGTGPEIDTETACGLESLDDTPVGRPDVDDGGLFGLVGDPAVATGAVLTEGPVDLDVHIVLDGTDEAVARQIIEDTNKSYGPLGIDVVVSGVTDATGDPAFATDDAYAKIRAAKSLFGGQRPVGSDLVVVMTATDIQQLGQYAIAGLADCIGGVAHDDRAFMVAETVLFGEIRIGPLNFYEDVQSTVAAHEMGHLMGGQHHYANCVEGISPSDVHDDHVDATPCSLMFNSADLLGHGFNTLNGSIVRGAALRHAGA